jgi:hypothetical protein
MTHLSVKENDWYKSRCLYWYAFKLCKQVLGIKCSQHYITHRYLITEWNVMQKRMTEVHALASKINTCYLRK